MEVNRRHTETVIHELCKKVCATTTEAEAEQVLGELREAIHEHLRLASETLAARASAMPGSLRTETRPLPE